MQILRLSGSSPRPWAAVLHPRLTVVHGVPPEVAAPLRAAVDALVRARISGPELAAAGLGGEVLVDGTTLPLEDIAERAPGLVPSTPRTHADLIGPTRALGAARARALEAEADAAAAALAEAEADLARAREAWAAAHTARTTRVAEGWRARAEAASALRGARRRAADAATAPAPDLGPRAVDTSALRAAAEERLEAARAAHDAAVAALEEAEERLEVARAEGPATEPDAGRSDELATVESELAHAPDPPAATPEERRAATERRARITHDIEQISLAPTDRVAGALADAEESSGIAAVEAAQVAVEWERVRDLVADEEAAPRPPAASMFSRSPVDGAATGSTEAADRVRRARDRVEVARRDLARASSSTGLDPTDVEALEAAHAEVLAAWEGSERRIGVGKARRRLEDAQLAEREILGRLGFASYTEFMMSGRAAGLPSTVEVDNARRGLAEAEAQLAAAEAEAEVAATAAAPTWDADAARGRMTATLDALRARAAELLGEEPREDVAAHLRDRIATDPISDLRLALDEAGLPLGEVLSRDEVLARARAWLAQQEGAASRRAALAAERVEVEDHLARLDAADGARAARDALVRRRDALRAEVEQARAVAGAVAAAEERVAHDRDEVARAVAERDAAEQAWDAVAAATSEAAGRPGAPPPVDVDLTDLEADARDAQTALDVAVSHLLPDRAVDDVDAVLGRAEARVALARADLAGLEDIRSQRAAAGTDDDEEVDVDVLVWQVLARLASQRDAAAPGGPGPTPLVLDEPFGPLDGDGVVRVCEALVGPAAAVQVVLVTERPEAARWLEGVGADAAALVDAHLLDAGAPT